MNIEYHNGCIYLTEVNEKDMKKFILSVICPKHSTYEVTLIGATPYDNEVDTFTFIIPRRYLYSYMMNCVKAKPHTIIMKGYYEHEND